MTPRLLAAVAAVPLVLAGCLAPLLSPGNAATGPQIRDFALTIAPLDVDLGSATWHAWAFNGQVPGPTLKANVGDTLRVTVHNTHNITHSFHTHLVPAGLASDGAQLNTITGIGGMAMIPPGGSYTYTLTAAVAGLNYYHCHSADGNKTISQHMAQGLYGAILIQDPTQPAIDTEVVFMGERGFDVSDPGAPYFVMNGRGLPGGEHQLERVFAEQGIAGVVAQLGKTVPIMKGRVGKPVEIAVVNIGDAVHSFHLHGMTAYSQEQQPGHPVPAQVVQLVPGAVDRIRLTPEHAGLWLFHCHVVSHADAGMIGVFLVDPADGELDLGPAANGTAGGTGGHGGHGGGATTDVALASGGPHGEFGFAPKVLNATAGSVRITFTNGGTGVHSLSIPALGAATGAIPPGAAKGLTVNVAAGSYEFVCAEPGHAAAGMRGTLVVRAG